MMKLGNDALAEFAALRAQRGGFVHQDSENFTAQIRSDFIKVGVRLAHFSFDPRFPFRRAVQKRN